MHIYPSNPTEVHHHFATISLLLTNILTFMIFILLSAGILYVITRFSHREVTFAQLVSLHLYLQLIDTLRLLGQGVLHLAGFDKPLLSLVETDSAPITLFTLWSIALAFIGYTRLIKFPKWAALFIAIVLGLAPYLITTLLIPSK